MYHKGLKFANITEMLKGANLTRMHRCCMPVAEGLNREATESHHELQHMLADPSHVGNVTLQQLQQNRRPCCQRKLYLRRVSSLLGKLLANTT